MSKVENKLVICRDDKVWTQFHVILERDHFGGYIYDTRPLAELDNMVYGRYIGGVAGYTPWWIYDTVPKSRLMVS
jgi:hypothetical protein